MQIITPSSEVKDYNDKKMVFLAGPIQGAQNWQDNAIASLADMDIYIANPRMPESTDYNEQIEWESHHLARADIIMFWIPAAANEVLGRSYGQTSSFELGEWLAKSKYNNYKTKVILGIDDGFSGKRYVVERLRSTNTAVHPTYEETLAQVRATLSGLGQVFFCSDTHFGSQKALKFSRRPFEDVEDMNWSIVRNWNKVVSPRDSVYHLGDFGDLEYAKHLNGNIHLILGNYEEELIAQNQQYLEELKSVFQSVQKELVVELVDNNLQKTKVHLSHKPSDADMSLYNAFGHIHGRQMIKKFGLDVGVDAHHFIPLSSDGLLFYKNSTDKAYDEEVFL